LIAYTRDSGEFAAGLSPRGGIALVRAAQAWALIAGHGGVHPEDVQAVLGSIVAHRLQPARGSSTERDGDAGAAILAQVPVP
jgi:MoxR-like ATPase